MRPRVDPRLSIVLAKIACIELLFGGPLMFYDQLRPVIGQLAALALVVAPVVLLYMGMDGLGEPSVARSRHLRVWLGIIGALMIVPMNAYGYWRVFQGSDPLDDLRLIHAFVTSVIVLVYLVLAVRALRASVVDSSVPGEFGGPIE